MSIKRVMVTGGRSPVALNLIRMLSAKGYEVYVSESDNYHLSKKSNAIVKNIIVPKPNDSSQEYIQALIHHAIANRIDLIIPTCEEIFHIAKAKIKFEENGIKLFSSDIDTLRLLHNKFTFNQFLEEQGILCPTSLLMTAKESIGKVLTSLKEEVVVLKPVYSRFASNVHFLRKGNDLHDIHNVSESNPWILQSFIKGMQYCSYSIAVEGKLLAHSCYPTVYTAGLGANVYFKHIEQVEIQKIVENIVRKLNFTGQIAFDFIVTEAGQVYPIECNPRATSGLHLFNEVEDFTDVFTKSEHLSCIYPQNGTSYKLGLPLLMYGLSEGYIFNKPKQFIHDFITSKEVIYDKSDKSPYFYQAIVSAVLLSRKWKTGKSMMELTTSDIEWSGD